MSTRRETLAHGAVVAGLLAATGLFPRYAQAFSKQAFDARSRADALKALGVGMPVESREVGLQAPDIADNGAAVPLAISTTLAGVRQMLLLVDRNPAPLIAVFNVSEAIEPNFLVRSKMAESCDVYAVAVMKDGKAFFAKKDVKVTLGGCG